jgi:hypothetical protein
MHFRPCQAAQTGDGSMVSAVRAVRAGPPQQAGRANSPRAFGLWCGFKHIVAQWFVGGGCGSPATFGIRAGMISRSRASLWEFLISCVSLSLCCLARALVIFIWRAISQSLSPCMISSHACVCRGVSIASRIPNQSLHATAGSPVCVCSVRFGSVVVIAAVRELVR